MDKIGSNKKREEIAHLRATALSDSLGPLMRIKTAQDLLLKFGPSDNNIAVVRRIIKLFASDTDANIAERAQKLRAKLAKRLEIKSTKLPCEIEELPIEIPENALSLEGIADEPEVRKFSDEWDNPAPLGREEQFRLIEVQRPYEMFSNGKSSLRPGADGRMLVEAALDGRPFSVDVLLKLHSHMQQSFPSGGVALGSGALFSELTRILRAQGVLPPIDQNEKSYGDRLMEELHSRS